MHPLLTLLLCALPTTLAIPQSSSGLLAADQSNGTFSSLPVFYNSTAGSTFDDWPRKLPITLGFLNSTTAQLRFTGNGSSGTFLDAQGLSQQFSDLITLMQSPAKPFVPRWLDLRSTVGSGLTFQCGQWISNSQPGGIKWSREFVIDFASTMQQLIASYGVRQFTIQVYDPKTSNATGSAQPTPSKTSSSVAAASSTSASGTGSLGGVMDDNGLYLQNPYTSSSGSGSNSTSDLSGAAVSGGDTGSTTGSGSYSSVSNTTLTGLVTTCQIWQPTSSNQDIQLVDEGSIRQTNP